MGDFRRDDRGGGRNFGRRDFGRPSFGGRSSGPREMHQAVCSSCGKDCEVPFRPTGSKPVYCSECFEKQGGGSDSRGGYQDRGSRRPDFAGRSEPRPQNNEQLDAINRKLDKILGMLTPAQVMVEKKVETKPEKAEEIVFIAKKKSKASKKKASVKK